MAIDITTILRISLPHRPKSLSRVAEAIGDAGGVIGEIQTLSIGLANSIREIAVETSTPEQLDAIAGKLWDLEGVAVLERRDRTFEVHLGGKIASGARHKVDSLAQLRDIYTPGVARVSKAIVKEPALVDQLTSIPHTVAICTNGTRVLGLGDIGLHAAMPVMEGKAVLYDQLVGLSAVPILIDTKDPREFVDTVTRIQATFGAIHLEDIRVPECFAIEEALIERLRKPVMHDDQHGTGVVALAAVLAACRMTGVDFARAHVGQVGLGAAGSGIARMLIARGARQVLITDPAQAAVDRMITFGGTPATFDRIMGECDIIVLTTGRPGLVKPEMVRKGQVILALTNPEAEIEPELALEAGARFASDGRAVNNALGYPGIMKGALLAGASQVNTAMKLAAAETIASLAPQGEVVPDPLDPDVHTKVTEAVRLAAIVTGLGGTAWRGSHLPAP